MTNLSGMKNFMELSNQIHDDYAHDDTLKVLQDLNAKNGDGSRWCSWYHNIKGLVENNAPVEVIMEAIRVLGKHIAIDAKAEAICDVWVSVERDDEAEEAEA